MRSFVTQSEAWSLSVISSVVEKSQSVTQSSPTNRRLARNVV
jgi:hypothetical protein